MNHIEKIFHETKYPNGHATLNQCRFYLDITSIGPRPNFDKFPRHFHVLF